MWSNKASVTALIYNIHNTGRGKYVYMFKNVYYVVYFVHIDIYAQIIWYGAPAMVSTVKVDWSPNFFKQVSNSSYIHGADKFSSKDSTQYLDMVSTLSKEYIKMQHQMSN